MTEMAEKQRQAQINQLSNEELMEIANGRV
jgi:hypothetical protein